jgi:hypothetical protein
MSMSNANTNYEILVGRILQGIMEYEGVENIRVEHNVKIEGKSKALHQIDIFWEFRVAGVTYRTCVECKNYTTAVKKSHVASFAAILSDIGNANGIVATASSFQEGAKLLAKQNNIRLVSVNHLIRSVHITMAPKVAHLSNFSMELDEKSVGIAKIRSGMDKISVEISDFTPLYNEDQAFVSTLNTFLRKQNVTEGQNRIHPDGLYLHTEAGPILTKSFGYDIAYVDLPPVESIVKSPHTAVAVIEEIVEKNRHYLHNDGTVSGDVNKA